MARGFIYVYERIFKEQNAMDREFGKIPINGRQTSQADQKRIRKIISDSSYQVAQECKVMLPDCRLVTIEELQDIERGRRK